MLCLSYIAYFYSLMELEKNAEPVLPGREWGGESGWGLG
jgi:hypothetical protein